MRAAAMGRRVCLSAVALWLAAIAPAAAQAAITAAYLQHFDAQKHLVALSDGETLAYIDIGPRDAIPVVLLHGYTDSARDWAPLAPFLSGRFRLIIPDLRGQGASSKPDCCYTRFDFAYDIKLLLERLELPSAAVAGHSLGSIVAQTFAEEWPGRTRRLILISSTGTHFGPLEIPASLRDPIDPDSDFMKSWWHESLRINPAFFSSRQRRDAAAIPARVWRAIAEQSLHGVDLYAMLPRIKAPTLLIWGGQDALEDTAGRAALRRGIQGAQVRVFPSLGHDLIWQNPRGVGEVMAQFIAGPR